MASSALFAALVCVAMATASAGPNYRFCSTQGSAEEQLQCMGVNAEKLYCDMSPYISEFLTSEHTQAACVIACKAAASTQSGNTGGLSNAAAQFVCPPLCEYAREFTEENRPDCGALTDADSYDPTQANYNVGILGKRQILQNAQDYLKRGNYELCRLEGSPEKALSCMGENAEQLYCDMDPSIGEFLRSDVSQMVCVHACRTAGTAAGGHTGGISAVAAPFVCPPLCQYAREFTEENRPDCGALTDAESYDPTQANYNVGIFAKRLLTLERAVNKLAHKKEE